ncbi:hypothetical protein C6A85_11055, partial [Mycobacterium sp. ITM-2017-0098]
PRKVNIGMLPEETFEPGDWVVIHMGFVVEKTDKAGADAALAGMCSMSTASMTASGGGSPRSRVRNRSMSSGVPSISMRAPA